MQIFAVVLALAAAVASSNAGLLAPATTLVRTPSLDSAVIQSDRLGGNFAYSSVEGHAYAAVSPVITNVPTPVGVSYSATPIGYAASPIAAPISYAAAPIAAPISYAAGPIASPISYAAAPIDARFISPLSPLAASGVVVAK